MPACAAVAAALRWFLALFWIPALVVRYELALPSAALVVALVTIGLALVCAARETLRSVHPVGTGAFVTAVAVRLAASAVAGVAAAAATPLLGGVRYAEGALLRAAVAGCLVAVAVSGLLDARGWPAVRRGG